jgi:hypothetical protein
MFDIADVPAPEGSQGWVPNDLDVIPPGPALAGWLASVEVEELSGFDRILVLRAHHRMASHYMAQTYRDMSAVTDALRDEPEHHPEGVEMSAEAEIRAALTLTRRRAESELLIALDLQRRLPRLFTLLDRGAIDVSKAKTMVNGTLHVSEDAARSVVDQILADAPALTTGQIRARLQRLCITAEPHEAKKRYDRALQSRKIVMQPSVDGTAHLFAFDLAPQDASAASRRINLLARSASGKDDPRTPDQIRADVYVDLLCGEDITSGRTGVPGHRNATDAQEGVGRRSNGDRRGSVDIRVDLTTLADLNDDPGHLAGYGPVIADIARKVADCNHDAEWRYTTTDPATGRPVATGTTRRRPTASQRRAVAALNPTCVFPGCRMPAANTDLDHRRDWAQGGPTTLENLSPLCRHDHRIKHEGGWTYRMSDNGSARWTSRLGHSYTTALPPP